MANSDSVMRSFMTDVRLCQYWCWWNWTPGPS